MKKILEIALVVFCMLFIANVVVAAEGTMGSLRGEVVAVDHHARTISLKLFPSGPAISPSGSGGYLFLTDEKTMVTGCNTAMDFDNIKVGELVNIKYSIDRGWYFAEAIDVARPLIVCNFEER